VTDHVRITLAGMRFHVRVGVLAHERELPQPLEVDLSVWHRARASVGAVLDYRGLYAVAAAAVAAEPLHYLEELASRVADDALALAGVARARVAVRKPHVMLPGPLGYAEVEVERVVAGTSVLSTEGAGAPPESTGSPADA
jgi:dihydroneopterin aldolase